MFRIFSHLSTNTCFYFKYRLIDISTFSTFSTFSHAAIADSLSATTTNPMLVKGYLRAGRSMLALGQCKQARAQFQKCVWTRPDPEAMPASTLERIHAEGEGL